MKNEDMIDLHNKHAKSLIESGAKNWIIGGTTFGPLAHQLLFASLAEEFGKGKPVWDGFWFNPGFPFRIWRDCGLDVALGRSGKPTFVVDFQTETAHEAVLLAGNQGVIVMQRVEP